MNERQKLFVEEYLVDLNATQAAIRAGYSEKTAQEQGSRLLSNVMVAELIAESMEKRSERTEITQDRVLEELSKIGFSDIRQAVRWGAKPQTVEGIDDTPYPVELVPSEDLSDDIAATISEVSLTTAGIKIKQHDKLSALEKMGKHLGMFVDRHEHSGKDGGPIDTKWTVEFVNAAPKG